MTNVSGRKIIIFMLLISLVAGFVLIFVFQNYHRAAQPESGLRPRLVIYSYSSFVDSLGPGPELIESFKKRCLCDVDIYDVGSGSLLIEKLLLSPDKRVDVVIGLDQLNLKNAASKIKWRTIRLPYRNWEPDLKEAVYSRFVPIDWSPMTFITRSTAVSSNGVHVKSYPTLSDFLNNQKEKSLALQDPELSTPGSQFLYWLWATQFPFSKLRPKVQAVAADWTQSYSFFQRKVAQAVFTYLTSIIYHIENKEAQNLEVIEIQQGHPAQIEYAAIPESCMSCGIAENFIAFLTEPDAQKIIMHKNYMLPVIQGLRSESATLSLLPDLKLLPFDGLDQFLDAQAPLIKDWKATF